MRIYFFRQANFAGGGRTHILQIDKNDIGQLTAENYYHLEMWPGEYHFSISLPREDFFGQVSPHITVSRQITLMPHPEDNTYVCQYTDGMGSSGISVERRSDFPEHLKDRTLAKSLTVRDTAQVTRLFEARYDGPAMYDRPHGEGTLSWKNGSIYQGTFEHGIPTRKARFFHTNGRIFMGPNHRGRPAGSGVLMTENGHILFAGGFVNEEPDGVGLRSGPEGPEFCIYDHGRDITKTFRQLAKEALDIEDAQQIKSRPDRVADITAEIQSQKTRLNELSTRHDPDMLRKAFAQNQKRIRTLEKTRKHLDKNREAEAQKFIEQLKESRYERELAKEKSFRKQHQAKIEKERRWCREESARGHNLCACAPLADDFQAWQECWEPLRKRYIE